MTSDVVEIGPILDDERVFVAKTWKLSQRFSPTMQGLSPGVAFGRLNRRVDRALDECDILVARDPHAVIDELTGMKLALAFVVVDGDDLVFAYTRLGYRRRGYLSALLRAAWPLRTYSTTSRFDWLWERMGLEEKHGKAKK